MHHLLPQIMQRMEIVNVNLQVSTGSGVMAPALEPDWLCNDRDLRGTTP